MIRSLGLAFAFCCLLTHPASAVTVAKYSFGIPCGLGCENLGLEVGDKARIKLKIDTSSFTPGGTLDTASLLGFSATAGDFSAALADLAGYSFVGTWKDSTDRRPVFSLNGSSEVLSGFEFGVTPIPASKTISISSDRYYYADLAKAGACLNEACTSIVVGSDRASFSGPPAQVVPLPPSGLLLSAGLALALFASIRQTRRHA